MRGEAVLALSVAFWTTATPEGNAGGDPAIPADLEWCAGTNMGRDEMFDNDIAGLHDWKAFGSGDCIYQAVSMWTVMECESGRTLDVVTYRSDPTEWSPSRAVVDVTEPAMLYRERLRTAEKPVSIDLITEEMLALGADVTERVISDPARFCQQN
jgi:hypothetical protein